MAGGGGDQISHLDTLLPGAGDGALQLGDLAAPVNCGHPGRVGMSMTLMVQVVRLPWPCWVEVDPTGTLFQGSALSAASRAGRLALTVTT